MESRSAKKAIRDILHIRLSEEQSQELYHKICRFLVEKDEKAYINLLRLKYSLLNDYMDNDVCDYFIMEYLLDKMEKEHSLILSAMSYLVVYKS